MTSTRSVGSRIWHTRRCAKGSTYTRSYSADLGAFAAHPKREDDANHHGHTEVTLRTTVQQDSCAPTQCLQLQMAARSTCALRGDEPTLRQRLRLGVLAALDQRISVRYAIAGMDTTETGDYIAHDAAPSVMRRGRLDRLASNGVSPRTFRIIVRV